MSVDHYENFPVASLLLPARLRHAVQVIYTFARSADDIADEGDATPEQRFHLLKAYEHHLDLIEKKQIPTERMFADLATVIAEHKLSITYLRDLLTAFKQDIHTKRYQDYAELMQYCHFSANPVGRIMLQLYAAHTKQNLQDSDAICSALQLINFLQDVGIDWQKQRIYLPLSELSLYNLSEHDIATQTKDHAWQKLMLFQTKRVRELMLSGSGLCKRIPGRLGWELRLVVQGGLRILEKIDAVNGDVFRARPTLSRFDWLILVWRAIRM